MLSPCPCRVPLGSLVSSIDSHSHLGFCGVSSLFVRLLTEWSMVQIHPETERLSGSDGSMVKAMGY